MGLHGGAIHIDNSLLLYAEEDRQGSAPFIIINNNTFTRNMAYFEGNAIYIKNIPWDDDEDVQ